ncbi:hypothetical protein HanHA300_Chr13g0470191 [Helianthus annuus]|nr:hypothetical protein HanHA300_Chr13g0470191 [Helianthus annuus]KAJ0662676.1 hypothetical protein HanLR1_Chr13g0472401 [Helianthus annuus]
MDETLSFVGPLSCSVMKHLCFIMLLSLLGETQTVSSCFCPLWMKHKVFLHVFVLYG